MDRELARKRPAIVLKTQPYNRVVPGSGRAIVRDVNKTIVTSQVAEMAARGQVEREYRITKEGGVWVAVVTLKPRRSWLRRNGLRLALTGGALVAFLAALAWAVSALVAALAAALPIVAGFLGVLALLCLLAALSSGSRVIEVVQKVRIKG
jgi:hypothetical protein